MATPKQPSDHLPKATKAVEPDEYFSFEAGGVTYTMVKPTLDVITPGFVRRNRGDQEEMVWQAIEQLANQDLLAWIDGLSGREGNAEWKRFQQEFMTHLGASLGE